LWNLPTKVIQSDYFNLQAKVTPTAERKLLEVTNKRNSNWLYFVQLRTKNFGICQQKQLKLTVFCSAAQRKNLSLIGCLSVQRAVKITEFANTK
jgi:hypothetical protein